MAAVIVVAVLAVTAPALVGAGSEPAPTSERVSVTLGP